MATSIKIIMKEGPDRDFPHVGRAGGSWEKKVRYEPGFVVVTDEWQNDTAIPADDVKEVIVTRH